VNAELGIWMRRSCCASDGSAASPMRLQQAFQRQLDPSPEAVK